MKFAAAANAPAGGSAARTSGLALAPEIEGADALGCWVGLADGDWPGVMLADAAAVTDDEPATSGVCVLEATDAAVGDSLAVGSARELTADGTAKNMIKAATPTAVSILRPVWTRAKLGMFSYLPDRDPTAASPCGHRVRVV